MGIFKHCAFLIQKVLRTTMQNLICHWLTAPKKQSKYCSRLVIIIGPTLQGKALRPRLILAMSEAVNSHLGISSKELERRQYEVAMIAEMYHTSSLYHDDVIDKAELRRNRDSVNLKWGQKSSVMAGNYAIATSNILLGQLRDPDVRSEFLQY